ncbi:MAG: DUF3990 domain-containing protein [Fibromonadaceae bacterium]|jgi:hypothetical protein|nr:DUF3990 domain-containing protein [Fibromonadaceae bacterium]
MLLYHGTFLEIKVPQIIAGKYAKDFGTGFYCTALKEQAIRWASRYETPILNTYSYEKDSSLQSREFSEMTEEWLDFIVFCRGGKSHDYNIVSGPMANDQIYNYISDYISGTLTREQFWVLAKFKHPTHQIALCTQSALKCLKYVQSEELK